MIKLIGLTFLIIISSCSLNSKDNHKPIVTVDLDQSSQENTIPDIKKEGDQSIGPLPQGPTYGTSRSKKIPVTGVFLGPGLYRAAGYIPLLKQLGEDEIKVHIITGSGFGAIVAAMYANGATPEKIEWNLYKFFGKTREMKVFSDEWRKVLDEFLLSDFKGKSIQNSNLLLMIPVFDKSEKKTVYLKRGSIYDALVANLNVSNDRNMTSPFARGFVAKSAIPEADVILGFDLLGTNITLDKGSSFLFGYYGKIGSMIDLQERELDFLFRLPIKDMPLDSTKNLASYLLKCYDKGQEISVQVNNIFEKWQNNKQTKP